MVAMHATPALHFITHNTLSGPEVAAAQLGYHEAARFRTGRQVIDHRTEAHHGAFEVLGETPKRFEQ